MRKIQVLGVACFAVLLFAAVSATAAFAEHPVWLLNGEEIKVKTAVLSETTELGGATTFLLADDKGGLFGEEVDVLCSGENEGFVGPGAADEVTKIFPLGGPDGAEILCETMTGICPEPEVLADNLPWLTELLLEGTMFVDDILGTGGGPGWLVNCKGTTDLCELEEGKALIENLESDVDAIFAPDVTPVANCTRGGEGQGLVEGEVLIYDEETGTLAASEVEP